MSRGAARHEGPTEAAGGVSFVLSPHCNIPVSDERIEEMTLPITGSSFGFNTVSPTGSPRLQEEETWREYGMNPERLKVELGILRLRIRMVTNGQLKTIRPRKRGPERRHTEPRISGNTLVRLNEKSRRKVTPTLREPERKTGLRPMSRRQPVDPSPNSSGIYEKGRIEDLNGLTRSYQRIIDVWQDLQNSGRPGGNLNPDRNREQPVLRETGTIRFDDKSIIEEKKEEDLDLRTGEHSRDPDVEEPQIDGGCGIVCLIFGRRG
jgi:hypothetical protein